MAKKRKPKPPKPRLTWDRNPVERPHSTPKGKRGYDRKEDGKERNEDLDDRQGSTDAS